MTVIQEYSYVTVILLGGLPASGKSTITRLLCHSGIGNTIKRTDTAQTIPSLLWHPIEADDFLEDEIKNQNSNNNSNNDREDFDGELYHLSRDKFKRALRDKAIDLLSKSFPNNAAGCPINNVRHIILAVDNFQFTSMRLEIWKLVRDINGELFQHGTFPDISSRQLSSHCYRIAFGQVLLKASVEDCVLRNISRQQFLKIPLTHSILADANSPNANSVCSSASNLVTTAVIEKMGSIFDYGNIPRSRVPLLVLSTPLCLKYSDNILNNSNNNKSPEKGTVRADTCVGELYASLTLSIVKFSEECSCYVPLPSLKETTGVKLTKNEESELVVYSSLLEDGLRKEVTRWMVAFPRLPDLNRHACIDCGIMYEHAPKALKLELRQDRAIFSKRMSILKKKFFESRRNGDQFPLLSANIITEDHLSRHEVMSRVSEQVYDFIREILRECCM